MARYALVIGIAEYVSPSLPRLSKTINDAEAIAQLLEQYGDFQSVQRLPQRWNKDKNGYEMAASKVTGAEIGQKLRTFLLEQAANNEALIYFSGHGFTISDSLGQQKGYLASSDCQIELKENQNVEQKYGIPLDSLNDLIRASQLSSLVMLLDSCNSGYFLERQLIQKTLNAFSSEKDYYLITACRSFERAGVIKSEEYSIFTGAIVKGLAAENVGSSRRISGDRLFDFVSNELKGSVQEPIRMGWGRSITLVTYPQLDIATGEKVAFNQENPYRGLYAFESEQAQYFCGRDEAVRTLISRLAESRFLAVIGYSGSGKSSLVKAGLLPQLKRDRLPGSSQWEIASFTPGEHPLGKLVDILARQQQQNQPHLLFIDQFEEVFTLCQDDEERKAFIRLIAQEVKKGEGETRIILTIRGDFLNRCADYLEIITLINSIPPTSFIVTPMSLAELEEAIEKPAKLHGVTFEHGLVSQIAADVINRPGALPILQYALKELWRVCIEEPESPQPLLTRKGYEEIGGVKGALDKRATILYQSLTTIDQAFARCLFMELVQIGEAGEVTRRRASWDRLDFNKNEKIIVTGSADKTIKIWSFKGQLKSTIEGHTDTVSKVIFSPDNKIIASGSYDGTVKIWTIGGRLLESLKQKTLVYDISFNPKDNTMIASANGDGVIQIWNIQTGQKLSPIFPEINPNEKILRLDFSPDGSNIVFSRNNDNFVRIWDIKTNKIKKLGFHKILVSDVKFSPEKNSNLIASSDYEGNIKIWDFKQMKLIRSIVTSSEKDLIYSLAFSPNGKILASSGLIQNKSIQLWDITGKSRGIIKGHTDFIHQVSFISNETLISASNDRTARIWQINFKNNPNRSNLSIDQSIKIGCDFINDYLNTTKDKLALQSKFLCKKDDIDNSL